MQLGHIGALVATQTALMTEIGHTILVGGCQITGLTIGVDQREQRWEHTAQIDASATLRAVIEDPGRLVAHRRLIEMQTMAGLGRITEITTTITTTITTLPGSHQRAPLA